MWNKLFLIPAILLFCHADCANILGIFPLPSKSHFIMFDRLFKGLAAKGHNVDIVTQFPAKEPIPRYNPISLKGSVPNFVNNLSISTFEDFSTFDMLSFMVLDTGVYLCEATLFTEAMENLKNSQKKYDLVITEIFGSDCMLGFGHRFKAPVVSLISSMALPWASDRIGNPDNPSYIPTYYVRSGAKMNLFERIVNTLTLVGTKVLYNFMSNTESNRIAKRFFGPDLPRLEELALNTSLILVNSHFSTNQARPAVPNFIEVGGLHINDPKPLSKKFEDLIKVEGTKYKGVIYLTMGSMIMTETFPPERIQGMFDAFGELPYKVLWKAVKDKFPKGLRIPDNIHFESWMPQMDILCHQNVKLFVSHGGLMGTQEAIYCGVPRLGIPLFADQENNIRQSEKMGMAVRVGYNEISKETILTAAKTLLNDLRYWDNVKKASAQFKDRPMSSLDTAIYWVEYVIRHNGAPHLRSVGADLTWYQYYLLDVGLILFSIIFGIIYITYRLFKILMRLVICKSVTKHKKE